MPCPTGHKGRVVFKMSPSWFVAASLVLTTLLITAATLKSSCAVLQWVPFPSAGANDDGTRTRGRSTDSDLIYGLTRT